MVRKLTKGNERGKIGYGKEVKKGKNMVRQ
jgi:hypothetical protein